MLDIEFVDVKLSDMKREVVDACVHDNDIGRNTDETRRVLQALQTGEQCPLDWVAGEVTLG